MFHYIFKLLCTEWVESVNDWMNLIFGSVLCDLGMFYVALIAHIVLCWAAAAVFREKLLNSFCPDHLAIFTSKIISQGESWKQ